jgi:hypothetical protein
VIPILQEGKLNEVIQLARDCLELNNRNTCARSPESLGEPGFQWGPFLPGVLTFPAHWNHLSSFKDTGAWAHPQRGGFSWSEIGLGMEIFFCCVARVRSFVFPHVWSEMNCSS